MKQQIQQLIAGIVKTMGIDHAVIAVTSPENPVHGDYTTNIAMLLAGQLKAPPIKIAQQIVDLVKKDQKNSLLPWLERVEVAPPGFINMFVAEATLSSELARVLNQKDAYGSTSYTDITSGKDQKTGQQSAISTGQNTVGTMQQNIGPQKRQKIKNSESETEKRAEKTDSRDKPLFGNREKIVGTVQNKQEKKETQISRVMVEFADPNPFKEFHIGHLRNITLGESFARLMESQGKTVRRVNYQGDVGMHVAKALWGLERHKKEGVDTNGDSLDVKQKASLLGKAYAAGAKAFEAGDEAKNAIIALNKKVYTQEASITASWKKGRQWSLDYFDTVYARVGTKFERLYFESEVAPLGMKIVLDHVADGIFEASDGATIYRGEKDGLHTRVFVTKEHYATYEAKDLALAPLKFSEWPYDLSIIMTGNEQSDYFKVMLAALTKIQPDLAGKTRHIPFGMVNLKEGKMSSRTGNVITAEWLIDEAKRKIYIILQNNASNYTNFEKETIAEQAAIGAVKYSMLKVGAASDIAFDLDSSVAFDGDSGPYLQYTYARCKSVLRKGEKGKGKGLSGEGKGERVKWRGEKGKGKGESFSLILNALPLTLNPEERILARLIMQFPDMVTAAAEDFAPNTLCTYLFQLAQAFNVFYAKHTILEQGEAERRKGKGESFSLILNALPLTLTPNLRLSLTAATAQVLKNGLSFLGITVLERM